MIKLENVIPIPLKEMPNGVSASSGIFNTTCVFEKGKNYLIHAPSGKGKSTLLHILYGLRKDYVGSATLNGQDLQNYGANDWAACRQGQFSIVFQDLRLFPKLTGFENILVKAGLKNTVSEQQIKEMAVRLGVGDILYNVSEKLSYGQRQRIAIIRALCQPFDYLLLDEPFSHLDEQNVRLASELIQEFCEEKKAGIILVSLGERYFFNYDEEKIL